MGKSIAELSHTEIDEASSQLSDRKGQSLPHSSMPKSGSLTVISSVLLLLCLLQTISCEGPPKNKAILFSSSLGYYNIRQMNNIVTVYNHLKVHNYRDEDILLLVSEMHPCCEKNHKFGTLSFLDGDYSNIFRNVEVDYQQSQLIAQTVADLFMGHYGEYVLNKRRLPIEEGRGEQYNWFFYVTGHGGDYYFKVREKEALIDEQFSQIFESLSTVHRQGDINHRENKIALMSDSCSAITPFETIPLNERILNFLALGSSSFEEKSKSHGYDIDLNQPKSDDFTFYFDELIKNTRNVLQMTLKEVWDYMDMSKLGVHSKLISTCLWGQAGRQKQKQTAGKWAEKQPIGEYISKEKSKIQDITFFSQQNVNLQLIL